MSEESDEKKMNFVLKKRVVKEALSCIKILVFPMTLVTLHGFLGDTYNYIYVWNTFDLECKLFKFEEGLVDIFELNDEICACIFRNGKVILWDVFLEEEVLTLVGHMARVMSIINIPGGYMTTSEGGTVKMWEQDKCIFSYTLIANIRCDCAVVLPNERLVLGTSSGKLYVLDIKAEKVSKIHHHLLRIIHLRLLPDNTLLSQCRKGEIRIWDITTWRYQTLFKQFDTNIERCADFMAVRNLPQEIVKLIQNDGKIYSLGTRHLVYVKDVLPTVIIIDLVTKRTKYLFLSYLCSNVMGDKLILGSVESLHMYSFMSE